MAGLFLAASPSPSPAAAAASSTSALPILDGTIVVVLLIALIVGYQRGIIQPLLTQLFFFGALFVLYREKGNFLASVQHYLHQGLAVAIFLALVIAVAAGYVGSVAGQALHRMPIARGIDGFLGIFVNVGIWLLVIYYLLSALIVFDRAFAPLVDKSTLTAQQVNQLSSTVQSNPVVNALISPDDLKKLKEETAGGKTASLTTVSQLDNLRTFYNDFIHPQLVGSKIAPYIMKYGQKVPIIGKLGPNDLPKK